MTAGFSVVVAVPGSIILQTKLSVSSRAKIIGAAMIWQAKTAGKVPAIADARRSPVFRLRGNNKRTPETNHTATASVTQSTNAIRYRKVGGIYQFHIV
jgi:hypothetical protein